MVRFGIRQARGLVPLMLALAAARYAAALEPDPAADPQQVALEEVQEALAASGAYSSDLMEPLTRLIVLYMENGEDNVAAVAIERAVQIVRVNNGLHSLDQVPLIQQLIRIEEARGRAKVAWDLERSLLTLVRRHPDDLRTMPILRDIGDKYMGMLDAFVAGEKPPQIEIGCFYKEALKNEGTCSAGRRSTVIHGLLGEAQRHYSDAIAVMLRNELYGSEELHDLEMQLLRVVTSLRLFDAEPDQSRLVFVPRYAGAQSMEPWRSRSAAITELATWTPPPTTEASASVDAAWLQPHDASISHSYYRGLQSLGRLYSYAVATASPAPALADAVVRMADWELLYSHHGQAVELYARAYAMLDESGATGEPITQLFAPPTPVVLPAFQPNPLAADDTRQRKGHIDVGFEITKYGRARKIDILGAENAADTDITRLDKLVATSRFRPRLTKSGSPDATPVVVRYYLYD
jgi:tetratricopeptide (TPR) repeat protein